ncbi:MAG: VWA domain-containing protein [Acetivibrionales bacterium]|jgi:Mg-chelatase subunit ChlD
MKDVIKTLWKSNLYVRIGTIALAAALIVGSGIITAKIINKSRNSTDDLQSDKDTAETFSQNGTEIGPSVTPIPDTLPTNSMAYYLSKNSDNYFNAGYSLTGKEIKTPVTGEVGTWDIPIPLINPLGSQELYTYDNHSYYKKRSHDIQYISNFTEYTRNLYGEVWYLGVNDYALPLQFLKDYAKKIGAEIYSTSYSDRLIFTLKQSDALWWCDARETSYGYELTVVKQRVIEPGREYTVTSEEIADSNGEYAVFTSISTGEKFQTLIINIPNGKVRIYGRDWRKYADNDVYCYYDTILYSDQYKTYILDDIPQGAGQLEWKFEAYGGDIPSSITFKLEESYELPKVTEGDEPGAILVKGVPFGSVFIQSQRFLSINYREGNYGDDFKHYEEYKGSRTPEGDTLFVVPPGLWAVGCRSTHMNYGSVKTQLVPVSSGEQTIVAMPDSLRSAEARLNSMADDSELIGSVEITETKDLTTTAEISVSVSDPLDRDINQTIETTEIFEGATKVEITDIRRVVAPCSVALVIDSSGSMKSDMKPALDAAKQFLESLPEGSFVKVIDFDTQVRVLKGETPAEAVKALSEITSGGYTKLYDATLKGLETVTGKTRPAVVVFTDGRDSSHDKTGGGSVNSRQTVTTKIKESKIPVYTIGFGKRLNEEEKAGSSAPVDGVPDIQCLLEFASAAGGQYYPAKDPSALPGVFAAISSKLGNNFVITYKRPTEYNISQTPFISMVVDNSGSMSSHPDEGKDCNFRMQKTISLFHNFIEKLPDNVMMQYATFQTPTMAPPLVIMHQTTTSNKSNLLKAIGDMEAHGGTPIVEALRTAYENILPVPSSRKVILFLTDGGLEVNPEQQQQYNDILEEIKEKNITILFVGMGIHSKEELFAQAAAATGGDYVISEDINEIELKLDKLLSTLKESTPSKAIPISVSLNWKTSDGEELSYGVAGEVEFSLPKKAGSPLEPDMVEITTGIPFERYDTTAAAVTGLGLQGRENVITNRVAYDKKLSNKAMELTVKQGVHLTKFQGVEAWRANKQFIALEVELENKTPEKIPYQIPSIFNHFYIGVNGEGLCPASKATWLSDNPLPLHGSPAVELKPGEKKKGVLIFIAPEADSYNQLSLHFYDTNYGHIQLPLVGKLPDRWLEVDKLPASAPSALSDTFSMAVTGSRMVPEIDKYPAEDLSSFKIVEAKFESKVQALLNMEPRERFWLKIDTKSGALMAKMSEVTAALPFGFLDPIMVGPASVSPARMAYEIPWQMGKYKSSIYTDLATGSKELPVSSGEIYGAPAAITTQNGPGISVTINQLVASDEGVNITEPDGRTRNMYSSSVILDVTINDLPGNEGTRIPDDFFVLVNKNYQAPSGNAAVGRIGIGGQESDNNLKYKASETNALAFGINSDFGVFEGQSRRGIVIFSKPGGDLSDWTLQSPYMESLQAPITKGTFASPELIGFTTEVRINRDFEEQLDAAVKIAVDRHAALMEETSKVAHIGLTEEDGLESVPMPPISTYGLKMLEQIKTEQQVIRTLQALRCLPLNRNGGYLLTYGYTPEAVLTQGWGDIGDMTNLALRLFAKMGFSPQVRPIELTEAGKKVLLDFTGVDVKHEGTKPLGITYKNAAGEHKMLVVPFMMDLSELEGFVFYQSHIDNSGIIQQEANIEVYARYVPGATDGSVGAVMGGLAGSLSGEEGGESVEKLRLLETRIEIAEACTDAMDLSFMPRSSITGTNNYVAVLSTPEGIITGDTVLENPAKVLGIEIVISHISGIDPPLVHYSTLGEGVDLSNFFQTIALNLPNLTEEAASILDDVTKRVYENAENPDPLSIAKWYGRNIIYSFIAGNSMFDKQTVDQFKLVTGRTYRPRCLIVSSHLDKAGTLQTTMDLLQPWNQIHAGEKEAANAYNLLSGFYMSSLEAAVLPGANKAGYIDLWTKAPSGTDFEIIPVLDNNRDEVYTEMEAAGKYPYRLLKAVKENRKLILTPLEPTVFNGEKRWAWLEIDPINYQAISVFDNGLHSAMTEFRINLLPSTDDTVQWLKGIWVGTNVSVWSMCSSTLKFGDDYKAVIADAKKTATEVCKKVAEFFDLVETAKGLIGGEAGAGLDLGSHKLDFKISMSGLKGSLSQNMYNLGGGMKTAVEVYFAMMAPPTPTPPPTGSPPPNKNNK